MPAEKLDYNANPEDDLVEAPARPEQDLLNHMANGLHQIDPALAESFERPEIMLEPDPKAVETGAALAGLLREQALTFRLEPNQILQAASAAAEHLVGSLYQPHDDVLKDEHPDPEAASEHRRRMAQGSADQLVNAFYAYAEPTDEYTPTAEDRQTVGRLLLHAVAYANSVDPENDAQRLQQALTGYQYPSVTADNYIKDLGRQLAGDHAGFSHDYTRLDVPTRDLAVAALTQVKGVIVDALGADLYYGHREHNPKQLAEQLASRSAAVSEAAPQWEQAIHGFLNSPDYPGTLESSITDFTRAQHPGNYQNQLLGNIADELNISLTIADSRLNEWTMAHTTAHPNDHEGMKEQLAELVELPEYQALRRPIEVNMLALRLLHQADQAAVYRSQE